MRISILRLIIFGCLALVLQAVLAPREAMASDRVFIEKKCGRCHSISAYNLGKKKTDASDSEEKGADEGAAITPPDLSNVGTFHDATFFIPFLKRELDHKPHPGNERTNKHKIKVSATDEEFKELTDWLMTLKKEPIK